MLLAGPTQPRRGATLVETAVVLGVFLILVLGMLDLGAGVFRYHLVATAARQGARQAIVHGSRAPLGWDGGRWGTTSLDVPATATDVPMVNAIRPVLVGCDPARTRIAVQWLDGSNDWDLRVRVQVSTPYQPMMTRVFGNATFTLRASSTMRIAH